MAGSVQQDTHGLWGEQDKDSFLDYTFDLSKQIPEGDGIGSVTWSAPAGITLTPGSSAGRSVTVWIQGGTQRTWYPVTAEVLSAPGGRRVTFTFRLFIREDAETVNEYGSPLFPNRFSAIAKMRRDRLVLAAQDALPSVELTDDYIWEKLTAAESYIAHELRVPLGPTRFFPLDPTQEQVDALGNMPWQLDPPYDWEPHNFLDGKWGYMILRNKPIIDVLSVRVAYPSSQVTVLDVPREWVRLDKKFGHLNLVPTSPLAMQTFGATLMPMISAGQRLPFSVHIDYTAGLQNVQRDYPELIDAVYKMAVIGALEDSFIPQSGSISADGLSQSMSFDLDKYRSGVDRLINGSETSGNGGLKAKLNGIRTMVL